MNDETANQIGIDNVGFMPFPAVDGGTGSIDEYPANVGLPTTMNDEAVGERRHPSGEHIARVFRVLRIPERSCTSGPSNVAVSVMTPVQHGPLTFEMITRIRAALTRPSPRTDRRRTPGRLRRHRWLVR